MIRSREIRKSQFWLISCQITTSNLSLPLFRYYKQYFSLTCIAASSVSIFTPLLSHFFIFQFPDYFTFAFYFFLGHHFFLIFLEFQKPYFCSKIFKKHLLEFSYPSKLGGNGNLFRGQTRCLCQFPGGIQICKYIFAV